MYISDKILAHGVSNNGAQFVVINNHDYPEQAGMRRTTYDSSVKTILWYCMDDDFGYYTRPDHCGVVGVEISRLREVRPAWCVTKDELLAQYQAMQRDGKDGPGPIKNLDLRKDPELLTMAKKLWSEKLAAQIKTT